MKITREADYALRIIAMLADENRQIEAKALRKLRHPSRSRKLKDFLQE